MDDYRYIPIENIYILVKDKIIRAEPVSNALSGFSNKRRIDRIREVVEGLISDLNGFKSKPSEDYVKTDEFEELLEETFKRVATERNEEKRQVYRSFLTDAVQSPGRAHDE